ncbi:hypothetical protein DSM106972_058660 [Dulcicalothrix desertica PCC 7102]|uniref:Uncharacterized protein n=1 Tax=Dulcicalothrix desertica PCC 7102 TaxID=232991 RepID=A0A3S1AJI8_9CYAN|nr:hypothetical protein DSM106972_058660 [Dulcicalothrix desertica PCC 7102]
MVLTNGVGTRIEGKNKTCEIIPAIKPAKIPKASAINKGVLAILKQSLGRVGLLINISFITIPIANKAATQGNRIISGKGFSKPKSVKKY